MSHIDPKTGLRMVPVYRPSVGLAREGEGAEVVFHDGGTKYRVGNHGQLINPLRQEKKRRKAMQKAS